MPENPRTRRFRPQLACLLLALPLIAHAQGDAPSRQVSLSGYGEVEAAADQAVVSLNATAIRRDSAEPKRDVDERVTAYLAALESLGIDREQIVAATLRTAPQYNWQNNQRTFTGYQAWRSLEVTIVDLDQLDAVLQSALEARIDGIGAIRYRSSEEDSLRLQARERAIADSRTKAAALAEAYGAELGPIRSIDYRSGFADPAPQPAMRMLAMESVAADAGGEYLPDQLTFTDQISVTFDLIVSP